MGSKKVAGSGLDGRILDHEQTGPTVARMMLGARLRRLREAGGITREEAGAAIGATPSSLSGLELGRTGFGPREVTELLARYDITDEAERATVLALAEQADTPGWWRPYADVTPPWLQAYVGLEQGAGVIRGYEPGLVPALLQTADYARALLRHEHDADPATRLERRVDLRMKRQRVLHRRQPPHLWAVIDEAALRRPVGSTDTMLAQLEHLIDICELPHITIQVMPLPASGRFAACGPVTLLRLPGGDLPDVVCLEQPDGAADPDEPTGIEHYRHVMNRLVTEAESPATTRATLHRILEEI